MIFFTLSGYLVSGLIFNELKRYGQFSAGRFLFRRGVRIYPAFWIFICVTMIGHFVLNRSIPWIEFQHELFFVQNFKKGLWSHTWTLAVEEHFYLLLALSILCFIDFRSKLGRFAEPARFAILAFSAVAILSMTLRFSTALFATEYNQRTHIAPTYLIMDAFAIGVLVNFLKNHRPNHTLIRWYQSLGPLRFLPLFAYPIRFMDIGYSPLIAAVKYPAIYLATAVLLLELPNRPLRFGKSLAWLGKHSYSIYLWHQLVNVWIASRWVTGLDKGQNFALYVAIYFSLSLLIGVGVSLVIETPLLRWRDRVSPSRSQVVT